MTYTLDPMPTPVSGPLLSRLARFETVLFGHFLDRGVLDPGVVPAFPVGTVTGTAVTLSLPGWILLCCTTPPGFCVPAIFW